MSIISALKSFIEDYPELVDFAEVHVDELGTKIVNYNIAPLAGTVTAGRDILGNKKKEFPFAMMSREYTLDDLTRVNNNGFYENFSKWLDDCSENGALPVLGDKMTATKIEATAWGYLSERAEDAQSGVYQINCKLYFTEEV